MQVNAWRSVGPAVGVVAVLAAIQVSAQAPEGRAAALLAADRAFGAQREQPMLEALAAALSDSAVMPVPGRGFAEGRAAILEVIARDTLASRSHLRWAPVRGGVSGDGSHGFTMGFMEVQRADGSHVLQRYLAYWVREASGWRMAVFRRVPRQVGSVDRDFAGALDAAPSAALGAEAQSSRRRELAATERAFSDSSRTMGLGEAFALFGHSGAWHLAGPPGPEFVRGKAAVVASVSSGVAPGTSPYVWDAGYRSIVAPSGDFGVNLGLVLQAESPDQPGFPFFTVWVRGADGRWCYVAE